VPGFLGFLSRVLRGVPPLLSLMPDRLQLRAALLSKRPGLFSDLSKGFRAFAPLLGRDAV
jgi:hypothetical protein